MAQQKEVNPNDFIITRKRKKYRFALFSNAINCFELEDWTPLDGSDIVVEVGAGSGLFLVELASLHKDRRYIAVDVKGDRLQKGAREALSRGLDNIFFVRARADQLLEVVSPETVVGMWLTFSDPFPRDRDAKRRLTHDSYLEIYKKSYVSKKAYLCMKTDDHKLFDWSLERFVANKWRISELTYDLHDSDFSDEYKIMTTYEKKWIDEGKKVMFCRVSVD